MLKIEIDSLEKRFVELSDNQVELLPNFFWNFKSPMHQIQSMIRSLQIDECINTNYFFSKNGKGFISDKLEQDVIMLKNNGFLILKNDNYILTPEAKNFVSENYKS